MRLGGNMAKLLKLRFLDRSDDTNNTYVEIYCDERNKRGYFRKITKDIAKFDDTTIRPLKKEFFEVRLLGRGWKQVDEEKFHQQLGKINAERIAKGWEPVTIFDPEAEASEEDVTVEPL